jgi:hypothetical protein
MNKLKVSLSGRPPRPILHSFTPMDVLPRELRFITVHLAKDASFFAAIHLRRVCKEFAGWITAEMTRLPRQMKRDLTYYLRDLPQEKQMVDLVPKIDSAIATAARLQLNQWPECPEFPITIAAISEIAGDVHGMAATFMWWFENIKQKTALIAIISVANDGHSLVHISRRTGNSYAIIDSGRCNTTSAQLPQLEVFHALAAFAEDPELHYQEISKYALKQLDIKKLRV